MASEAGEEVAAPRIRLVALDIDGTLLDPQGRLTLRTANTIRAVEAVGVTVALATSRRWTPAAPIAALLGQPLAADGYPDGEPEAPSPHEARPSAEYDADEITAPPSRTLILCDGAMIRSHPTGDLLLANLTPAALAQAAATLLASHGLPVTAQYTDAEVASREYLVTDADPAHPEWIASYLAYYQRQTTFAPIATLCAGRLDPLRLMAFGPVERLRAAAEELAVLGCGTQIIAVGMYEIGELMVFAPSASKGAAFAWLAARLGVALSETLAIGDGVNDVSLLRAAGLGVAMGNAVPEALAAADAVTASNAADGVALALDRYILTPEWLAQTRLTPRAADGER